MHFATYYYWSTVPPRNHNSLGWLSHLSDLIESRRLFFSVSESTVCASTNLTCGQKCVEPLTGTCGGAFCQGGFFFCAELLFQRQCFATACSCSCTSDATTQRLTESLQSAHTHTRQTLHARACAAARTPHPCLPQLHSPLPQQRAAIPNALFHIVLVT